ncbi:LPS translocon maturation chaperone LptM [Noviherbaspirillum humi]|uniref:LPS translocon maturation chaperone LptM n=1 Tax=Noviherbaspirillum humi TaxID=1688639 RepID=UPI000B78AA76|nr:lipoprotein [Noviherbaspirillum humi]
MLHSAQFVKPKILTVKPALHIRRRPALFLIAALAAGMALAGCGQKGPLYLPAKPVPATPAASAPAVPPPVDANRDRITTPSP